LQPGQRAQRPKGTPSNPKFLLEFEHAAKNTYHKTKKIADTYFDKFYKKEKEAIDKNPQAVANFLQQIHDTATYVMSYYFLTQPQRFYKFDQELSPFLPNKNLELISTTGRYLTYISGMRKSIIHLAQKMQASGINYEPYLAEHPREKKIPESHLRVEPKIDQGQKQSHPQASPPAQSEPQKNSF
jgi:hypothetical protein